MLRFQYAGQKNRFTKVIEAWCSKKASRPKYSRVKTNQNCTEQCEEEPSISTLQREERGFVPIPAIVVARSMIYYLLSYPT